jgi:hypothetical protein
MSSWWRGTSLSELVGLGTQRPRSHYALTMSRLPERWVRMSVNHSVVDTDSRCFIVAVPKNGCTTIKTVFCEATGRPVPKREHVHPREHNGIPQLLDLPVGERLKLLMGEGWTRVTTSRDPVARLESGFRSKFGDPRKRPRYVQAMANRGGTIPESGEPRYEDFVDWVASTPDHRRDPHWRSQTGVMLFDEIRYDHVLRLETLSADLVWLLSTLKVDTEAAKEMASRRVNMSQETPLSTDKGLLRVIRDAYAADYEKLGYPDPLE